MVVKLDESGQSVVEFLIMLPMMLGLVVILVRVNSAIQMSIVNQQYARAGAHWLAFNSSIYPERDRYVASMTAANSSRMIVGVAENQMNTESQTQPEASIQQVTRGQRRPGSANDNSDKENLRERELVRIRTTVAMCTQVNSIELDGKKMPLIGNALAEQFRPDFCRSAQNE